MSDSSELLPGHSFWDSVLLAGLISATIFLVCPAFIASSNLESLDTIPLGASAKALLIAFAASLGVLLLLLQIKMIRPVFYALLIFVALSALVLPVTSSSAMIDAEQQQVNYLNLVICLIIAALFGFGSTKYDLVKKLGVNIVTFVTLMSLGFSLFAIINAASDIKPKTNNFSVLSSKKNIFVMSFDGVPGVIMKEVLEENETTISELKDFTYFSKTYSQSPATEASAIGEMHGVHDYKKMGETTKQLKQALSKSDLYADNYVNKVKDFQHQYAYSFGRSTTLDFSASEQHSNLFLLKNSFSRIFTSKVYKTGIPSAFEYFLSEKKNENESLFGDEQNHKGAEWDLKNVKKIDEFDQFVSSLAASDDSDFSVRYYHNVFSHFPVDFGENCEYISFDQEMAKNAQNREGLKRQTRCVYKKMLDFVQRLKEIGVYDNSIIVFKSDHGEPFYYFDKSPDNLSLNRHRRWGYNRYRPFMMMKNFKVDQDSLKYDNRRVLLNDMAKTLCKASGVVRPATCKKHNGIDLFTDEKGLKQPYYLYIPAAGKSTFKYDTHVSVKVPNRIIDTVVFLRRSELVDVSDDVNPARVVK